MTWRHLVVALGLAAALVTGAVWWGLRTAAQPAPQVSPVEVGYGAHHAQRLDLYEPDGAFEKAAPVIVYLHGGGWSAGDKSAIPGPLVELLTANGYAVASVGYRLTGQARFPAQIHDVRAAIAYLAEHAASLGVDAHRMVLAGDSAGGHLAQLAAVTAPRTDESSPADPTIRGVISYSGLSDLRVLTDQRAEAGCRGRYFEPAGPATTLFAAGLTQHERQVAATQASPVTHVDGADPPMLLLHGAEDCIVPAAQSAQMRDALTRAGVNARTITLDAGHSDPRFFTGATANDAVLAFLRSVIT